MSALQAILLGITYRIAISIQGRRQVYLLLGGPKLGTHETKWGPGVVKVARSSMGLRSRISKASRGGWWRGN